ncbi:hypothetical protein EON66_08510, partial [archaeon]
MRALLMERTAKLRIDSARTTEYHRSFGDEEATSNEGSSEAAATYSAASADDESVVHVIKPRATVAGGSAVPDDEFDDVHGFTEGDAGMEEEEEEEDSHADAMLVNAPDAAAVGITSQADVYVSPSVSEEADQHFLRIDSMFTAAFESHADSPLLHLLYAQYCGDVISNEHLEREHLMQAQRLAGLLSFDVSFFVHQRLAQLQAAYDDYGLG